MRKQSILLLFICILLSTVVYGNVQSGNPNIAMQLLQTVPDARSCAMGNSYGAIGDDIYSMYYNPAGLAAINHIELPYSRSHVDGDKVQEQYGFAYGLKDAQAANIEDLGAFGATLNKLEMIDGTDKSQSIIIGYGKSIIDDDGFGKLTMGANAKYFDETSNEMTTHGMAYDAGVIWKYPHKNIFLDAAYSNFGSRFNDTIDLPANFRYGAGAKLFNEVLIVNVEENAPINNRNYFTAGSELTVFRSIALRAGYNSNLSSGKGITAGAGLKIEQLDVYFIFIREIDVDYFIMPWANPTGIQRLSVNVKFGAD